MFVVECSSQGPKSIAEINGKPDQQFALTFEKASSEETPYEK